MTMFASWAARVPKPLRSSAVKGAEGGAGEDPSKGIRPGDGQADRVCDEDQCHEGSKDGVGVFGGRSPAAGRVLLTRPRNSVEGAALRFKGAGCSMVCMT